RIPAIPGPGGYPGGVGRRNGSNAESGAGPGAGGAQTTAGGNGCAASHAAPPTNTNTNFLAECNTKIAAAYRTSSLLPLVGGSGGSGGSSNLDSCFGAGGGAGGGAIRMVSTTEIRFLSAAASILANGGIAGTSGFVGCGTGGPGSGGAIHLQA